MQMVISKKNKQKIGGHTYKIDFKDWDRQRRALYSDKGSIHQKQLLHIVNIRVPTYMMQKFTKLKEKVGNNIIIVGDLNTLLSIVDRVIRH